MLQNFNPSLKLLLSPGIEGGFSDNPQDPGGMTNHGVTARQWAAWLNRPLSAVTKSVMQALTPIQVSPFYLANYWNIIDGNGLAGGVDAMVFHFEVNAGGKSVKMLQKQLDVVQDGVAGPQTMLAQKGYILNYGAKTLILALADAQLDYYKALPDYGTFGDGWTNRVNSFQELALSLAT